MMEPLRVSPATPTLPSPSVSLVAPPSMVTTPQKPKKTVTFSEDPVVVIEQRETRKKSELKGTSEHDGLDPDSLGGADDDSVSDGSTGSVEAIDIVYDYDDDDDDDEAHHNSEVKSADRGFDYNRHARFKVDFNDTEHCRMRKLQRGIDSKDLEAVLKYGHKWLGVSRKDGTTVATYDYNGITYIANDKSKAGITCWAAPIVLHAVKVTDSMVEEDNYARTYIEKTDEPLKSHSVIVVDTSGSMRNADTWGARHRLQAVWISLALDYIAPRLEDGTAGPLDVVSVVLMGMGSRVLFERQPWTWVLYNRIVKLCNTSEVVPHSHGMFLPSLRRAKELLEEALTRTDAVALSFLTDGKPSDSWVLKQPRSWCESNILSIVQELAKECGRQLSFVAMGIGCGSSLHLLKRMVNSAKEYGASAFVLRPTMSVSGYGQGFSTLATSLTSTQFEMHLDYKVRRISRESITSLDLPCAAVSATMCDIFPAQRVVRYEFVEEKRGRKRRGQFEPRPLQHPSAGGVAMRREPFGEGAERFAFRFYEVGQDLKTVVGPPKVAKIYKFVLREGKGGDHKSKKFSQKNFCATQQLASRLAVEFNAKLDQFPASKLIAPRVQFLQVSIYSLKDATGKQTRVVVEDKLEVRSWQKWNCNNGFVQGMKEPPKLDREDLNSFVRQIVLNKLGAAPDLPDDEEGQSEPYKFTCFEVAQAFSHFTYLNTGRKRLVCDIQGVHDEEANIMRLSDPVIHYYDPEQNRKRKHGITDKGLEGVALFFASHQEYCGRLCQLVCRGGRKEKE
jgi:Alpha-kinase family